MQIKARKAISLPGFYLFTLFSSLLAARGFCAIFTLLFESITDFFSMHGNISGSIDPDADLISANAEDGDLDVIPDQQLFSYPARQNEHGIQ